MNALITRQRVVASQNRRRAHNRMVLASTVPHERCRIGCGQRAGYRARRGRTSGLGRPGLPGLISGRTRAGATPGLACRGVLPVVLAILAGQCDRLPDDRQVVTGQDHPVVRDGAAGLRRAGRRDPHRQTVRPGFW